MAEQRRRAAVLGRPVAHSLSPLLHRAAYSALNLDWRYDAIECDEAALAGVLAQRTDWAGFSCTMPLKRAVVDLADEVSPAATAIGAGNTLLPRPDGGWIADNTDLTGIVGAVHERGLAPATVTVLGAGSTAQAAIAAVAELGLGRCAVLVRDVARTHALRLTADALRVVVDVGTFDAAADRLEADLVISTLPPNAADVIARGYPWGAHQAILDVVYDPWPTALADAASRAGAKVLSGALMLLHQAGAQVELMTGLRAPLDAMRAALASARTGTW